MSEFKVSLEKIELIEHPNADLMEIGKVGTYQVVVQKGLYKDGDVIAFVPEKAVLPPGIKERFENYLVGPNKDRVKSIRLRGEYSCGVILPLDLVTETLGKTPEIGEDISEGLGIVKYEPPIPIHLAGNVKRFGEEGLNSLAGAHDCNHFRAYSKEILPGERVVVTEKVHGSQCIITYIPEKSETTITSKGLRKQGLYIEESDTNSYWVAYRNSNIKTVIEDVAAAHPESKVIRVFGEMVPCQKGYSYGKMDPEVLLFDIRVDGVSIPYDQVPESAKPVWIPVLYDGPFEGDTTLKLCKGKENVSGKSLHIREGVVVSPYIIRKGFDGNRLTLKVISPEYKETGEEFN